MNFFFHVLDCIKFSSNVELKKNFQTNFNEFNVCNFKRKKPVLISRWKSAFFRSSIDYAWSIDVRRCRTILNSIYATTYLVVFVWELIFVFMSGFGLPSASQTAIYFIQNVILLQITLHVCMNTGICMSVRVALWHTIYRYTAVNLQNGNNFHKTWILPLQLPSFDKKLNNVNASIEADKWTAFTLVCRISGVNVCTTQLVCVFKKQKEKEK